MIFTTKEELIEQANKDGACDKGIKFAKSCKDLQEIFETIDKNMSCWCIIMGYDQFSDYCDWGKLSGLDWRWLLSEQPQYADHCDWSKLSGDDWSWLLRRHPQFADHCDWLKLDLLDWSWLLISQPQFADICDLSKFNGDDWSTLLSLQPQLASFRK